MVGTHLQTIAVSQIDILLVFIINAVAAFRGLEIDVSHLRIAHRLPEHIALIVAQVDAVDVAAGVLTLHMRLGKGTAEAQQTDDE